MLIAAKKLVVNCGPLSVRCFVCMETLLSECPKKILNTVIAVVFVVGVVLLNSQNRSVIMAMYGLPLFVLERRPGISMTMNSSGFVAGNNHSFRSCLLVHRLREHYSQFLTVHYTSFICEASSVRCEKVPAYDLFLGSPSILSSGLGRD